MKRVFILLFFAAMIVFASCTSSPNIVGRWEDIKTKGKGFQFESDVSMYIITENELKGGKNFNVNGKAFTCGYELDKNKSPMWLDIFFTNTTDKKEERRLLAIINFIDDKTIEIMVGSKEGSRPISINTKSTGYERLVRIENN